MRDGLTDTDLRADGGLEFFESVENLHGFDPFKIPSSFAMADGARQAQRLIGRHIEQGLMRIERKDVAVP